jgi:hypothetical protein
MLGDWYANLLYAPSAADPWRQRANLSPVLVPAKGHGPVTVRLIAAVGEMLRAIGIRQTDIEAELTAMVDATIGTTASRRVLGSMNDFASMLDTHLERGDTRMELAGAGGGLV